MKTRNLLLSTALIALVMPSLNAAATPAAKPSPKAIPPAAVNVSPASTLTKGMAGDAVRKIMGKPAEIKPMESPTGKGEVWVFTRQISSRTEQIGLPTADIVTMVVGSDGRMTEQRMPGPLQYQSVQFVLEETNELLMFNDHFVAQKTSRHEDRRF